MGTFVVLFDPKEMANFGVDVVAGGGRNAREPRYLMVNAFGAKHLGFNEIHILDSEDLYSFQEKLRAVYFTRMDSVSRA
ncbi:hypothetical protein VNO77_22948 [Canavalia gladiata]|uniref:Uncharacterized protein n=1 Tax=Canavalia gladiata TaxID=3824 RepID=A0AAN9L6Z7_CANGL